MANKDDLVIVIKNFWNLLDECEWLHQWWKPIIKWNINAILLVIASLLNEWNTKDVLQAINEALNMSWSWSWFWSKKSWKL